LIDLNINIDHVATIRNARGVSEPDPIKAAIEAENAGATGIVCHLREDRRHIKDQDVRNLKQAVRGQFDLEMALSEDIINLALGVRPDLITLVPEKREELTTEGGLNVIKYKSEIAEVIKRMHDNGIKVSLFVEPEKNAIEISKEINSDLIEIHTGKYANHYQEEIASQLVTEIAEAAEFANSLGLKVAAGHGLNYKNTNSIAALPYINELSIGHSVISNSIFWGIGDATKKMLEIIKGASRK
jgi:pyridoxine 5-phosphate synthase